MSEITGVTLKRSEIGNCSHCGAIPEGEEFTGRFNKYGTHMNSQGGWWLRVVHEVDIFKEDQPRLPDRVSTLLCPSCTEKHNERIRKLLNF